MLEATGVDEADALEATESPLMLVALTVNVYAVPFVRPVMVNGDVVPEIVEPSLAVTVYPVTDDPPLLVGAVNETVTCASPLATVTPVGALGTVDGVAADEAVDWADVPIPLVAVTLNVYGVPFVNPVTTQVSVGATEVQVPAATFPDVYAVTVYPVTSEPRESNGASQETVAVVLPFTAVTFRGSEGAAFTDALVEAVDAAEVPAALVAVTLKV